MVLAVAPGRVHPGAALPVGLRVSLARWQATATAPQASAAAAAARARRAKARVACAASLLRWPCSVVVHGTSGDAAAAAGQTCLPAARSSPAEAA